MLKRSRLSIAVAVALLVLPILGVSAGDSVNSASSTTTTIPRLESFCTVALYGYLTVRVTDENGKPIQNALVLINGTLTCNHQTGTVDRSGLTDSDGYVWFDAYPTKYNISVILPETLQGRTILVTQTTFPVGTFQTTLHVACTPSANQCAIGAPQSQTQTTSVTTAPIPFLDLPAILFAMLLGLFVVARKKRKEGSAGLGFTRWTIDFYVRASMR